MGVTLYFSNQLMPLAEKLRDNLVPKDAAGSPLDAPVVIVPNMNLSKWIKLTLARQCGIFMNVDFQYLENGLWRMLRHLAKPADTEPELLDRDSLRLLLFFLLISCDSGNPDLAIIDRYLRRDEAPKSELEIRCWQLSGELARLFQEYEYHRLEMIQDWQQGDPVEEPMERCQRRIYRDAMSLKTQLGQACGRPICSMAEHADLILGGIHTDHFHGSGLEQVHLFGLSQISPFHLQLLSRLKPYFDIRIYGLNPSREYWEDMKTPFEKKWIRRRSVRSMALEEDEILAGELFHAADHPLLSAWGKPGRENIRLLCQLTDYDFEAGFYEPGRPNTVLAAIRDSLLTLDAAPSMSQRLPQDTSLQILACPGIRREVETVYDSIVHNLASDSQLCMTDIAVMVSDMARYKPVVDSVFNRQPRRINYNLVDSAARTESVFAQAVLAFIELARGSFTRKQVFDLLRNPCVMKKWSYGPESLAVWVEWADALGIFHGYENPTCANESGPKAGRFSWKQGLERLRLSRIMTAPTVNGDRSYHHFNGLVPFSNIHATDDRLVEKFCRIVESLSQLLVPFKLGSAPIQRWRALFFNVLDRFVEVPEEMRGEETVFQSLVTAFDQFERYDEITSLQSGPELTAEALWAFVQSHLDGISGGQGDYLTGGVTVAALMPMRPMPFKVVYVLGLEEGRFPGRNPESMLDLRTRRRRIGDISPAERNRYLFLEILISVATKLYLSYVSRDLQKDRDLAPCSVILQLLRYVEKEVLDGNPFKIKRIPIRPDSPESIAPDAVNGWSDVMATSSSAHRLSCYRRSGLWEAFQKRATLSEHQRAARFDPDLSLPIRTDREDPASVSLTIGLLRNFLLDPVSVVSRYHLGIDEPLDSTAELAEMEDEPLSSQFPADYRIRTVALKNWLADCLEGGLHSKTDMALAGAFDAVYGDLSRRSMVPDGAFARHDHIRLKQEVLETGHLVTPLLEEMRSARQFFSAITLGRPVEEFFTTGDNLLQFDPVPIPLPGAESPASSVATLSGQIPWIWQAVDGTWHCLVVTGSGRTSAHADKYVLEPLLTFMALSASDSPCPWSDDTVITVHAAYRSRIISRCYKLYPRRSADYLSDLLEDFYTPAPVLWLPFATVFDKKELRALIVKDGIDSIDREAFRLILQEAMKDAADPRTELIGAVVTADILDKARSRFRVFAA